MRKEMTIKKEIDYHKVQLDEYKRQYRNHVALLDKLSRQVELLYEQVEELEFDLRFETLLNGTRGQFMEQLKSKKKEITKKIRSKQETMNEISQQAKQVKKQIDEMVQIA